MGRILIAGGPRTGKTTLGETLSKTFKVPLRQSDTLKDSHPWSDASATVAGWMNADGPWVIEGVAVPRAVRKWLAAHRDGKPADTIVWLEEPHVELTPGQRTMWKGCITVWHEVWPELLSRRVTIQRQS